MPPMSDRYNLFIAATQSNANLVLLLFVLANAMLAARSALSFIASAKSRTFAINAFDLYLIGLNAYLFFVTN